MTKINYINIIHKHTIIGFLKRNIFCFNNQFISTIYYFYIFIPFFFFLLLLRRAASVVSSKIINTKRGYGARCYMPIILYFIN